MPLATTPDPPYVLVLFTALPHPDERGDDAPQFVTRTLNEARSTEGFLDADWSIGPRVLVVTYWENHEAVRRWKARPGVEEAVRQGHSTFARVKTRIARVEFDYGE